MKNEDNYNLTAKEAAEILGKSVTTVHRYINKGKLSGKYVNTDHGREVRLKDSEVKRLTDRLNGQEVIPQHGKDLFPGEDKSKLDLKKLLARYEQSLYQVGKLSEKLHQQKQNRKKRISQLENEKERLQSHLDDRAALIEALKSELNRPLTIKERLSGERSTNH